MRKIVIFLLLIISFVSCKEKKIYHVRSSVDGVRVDGGMFFDSMPKTLNIYPTTIRSTSLILRERIEEKESRKPQKIIKNKIFANIDQTISICNLPLQIDSILISFYDINNKRGRYIKYINGKECYDTTGQAKYNRRKLIGDTLILHSSTDTTLIKLLTIVDGIKLITTAYKVVYDNMYFSYQLYTDTLTHEHSIGNSGWGESRSINFVPPFKYLQMDKTAFTDDIKIYGEFNK